MRAYDLLILPPSFPLGGMENPRLTFVTPTLLAGDRSLVAVVAHELAHSWSGNLVTNATWNDFWLNEGFTTYVERRILEEVYGTTRAEIEAFIGRQALEEKLARLAEGNTILHLDLTGRDPDDGFNQIAYQKGALFLRHLEETFGRPRFDVFLRNYFNAFAFESITTKEFVAYMREQLLDPIPELADQASVEEWINKPGLPHDAPRPSSNLFGAVEERAESWLRGEVAAADIPFAHWDTQERQHFLRRVHERVDLRKMEELDGTFHLTDSNNSEILHTWLVTAIRHGYKPAYERLEEYLTSVGRMKYLRPLYRELIKTPEGKNRALEIFKKARATYHSIAATVVENIIGKSLQRDE